LRDLGEEMGVKSYLIDDEKAINPKWLENVSKLGLTAGASAPEILVDNVIKRLKNLKNTIVQDLSGITENTKFKLPPEVTDKLFNRPPSQPFKF
jgi:4-hydroxy-3-methylbut-2-en-1-yl diphosphate reductase